MRLHFTIGCYDLRRTSRRRHGFQFSRIQVLFADHVHRRSGVYNKFSFLRFKVDGAGKHLFSEWEKNAVLSFSFNFWDNLGHFPRCFAGTSLLPFRLFLRLVLKLWSIGVSLMRFTWANHSKRWILVSNVSMTYHGFSELNTSEWFPYVWALPQNRCRLRRLHILTYGTQLSCNFQHSHCSFVTILFRPFARLFINLAMRTRALFPKLHPFSNL